MRRRSSSQNESKCNDCTRCCECHMPHEADNLVGHTVMLGLFAADELGSVVGGSVEA